MLGNAGKRGRMLPAKWKGKWWMSHFKVGTRWSSPEIWRCDRNIRNIVTKCREKLVENNQQTLCVRKKLDTANRNIPVLRKFWDLAPQQSGLKNSPGLWIDCGTPNQEGLGAPWSEVRIGSNHLYRKSQLCPASHAFPASRFPGRDFLLFPRQPCFRRGWQWGRLIENLRADPANETIQVATSVQKVGGMSGTTPPKKNCIYAVSPVLWGLCLSQICSIELTVHKLVYINILGLGHRRFWSCVMLTVQI